MRSGSFFLFILLSSVLIKAQDLNPVSWTFSLEESGDSLYLVHADARIEPHWKLYSHFIEEGGPIPTDLYIDSLPGLRQLADIEEEGKRHGPDKDPIFGIDVSYYMNKVRFTRKVYVAAHPAIIKGYVLFMVCNDEQCLPPRTIPFELTP